MDFVRIEVLSQDCARIFPQSSRTWGSDTGLEREKVGMRRGVLWVKRSLRKEDEGFDYEPQTIC